MQNASPESGKDSQKCNWGEGSTLSTANTGICSPKKGQSRSTAAHNFMADLTESDDEEDSEVDSFHLDQGELDDEFETPKYLLTGEGAESPDLQNVDPETQARLEALLEAAGIGKLSTADGKHYADPEVLKKLTSSVSCALDEAAAALSRMRAESAGHLGQGEASLAEACSDGDAGTVKKLLEEGRNVNETTEEGDSLLSLACQAGYYELAQVLLAMRANVEDRGMKGDCTPLMEAASAGHLDIVKLLINHGADVNSVSNSGNTPLMYACAGGHSAVVSFLLEKGARVEDHNENGHTPLMEAASAGHVGVAKILLAHGAGVNTHSNEFKESALTLACYKGHLEMVRFLLQAGADQEHKTDEMHTALMEASMDGHVEVARLLLDSGAQVNMPADSFESPLTLAACGGHVELAMLLLERGASLEEVNDEGYTPLMEAAREGHEEMVALLLSQGADLNAQTDETQETALTLACCGGFLEVADFLYKAGADIELGASTPLMEAAQEGRLELVKYLLNANANVHACTQTGDTALTYACENGHTDVADLLIQSGAELEHESEGGRTPLMKAARAGHHCTVQFLINHGADVNRQTTNNDHTPLSLACAGGHLPVLELLLAHSADPLHRLKDNSTMLIEAAKGGHAGVVQYLLDYPHNLISTSTPPEMSQLPTPTFEAGSEVHRVPPHGMPHPVPSDADQNPGVTHTYYHSLQPGIQTVALGKQDQKQHALRTVNANVRQVETLTTAELQQVKNAPHLSPSFQPDFNYDFDGTLVGGVGGSEALELEKDVKPCERLEACINNMMKKAEQLHHNREEQILQKQQILEELQRVERELQEKAQAQILLSTQAQLRIEQHHAGQVLPQPCSHHGGTCTTGQAFGSLMDLGREIAAAGDLALEFSSSLVLPPSEPIPPRLDDPLVLAPTSSSVSSPSAVTDKLKVKSAAKKECKVAKQKDGKFHLQLHQEAHQFDDLDVEAMAAASSLSPYDTDPIQEQALLERLQASCGESFLEGAVSASQVQSLDSAVVSVGMGVTSQHPLELASAATAIPQPDENVTKGTNLKSITQIKNHLNSGAVNACSLLGNIPHAASGSIPHLPVTTSQPHFVPTSTVATQYIDPSLPTSSLTVPLPAPSAAPPGTLQVPLQNFPLIDINSQTDSNHDTALTLACAGGHEDLVHLLLARGPDMGMEFEHRDKKGFTPLILAATAGHAGVVEILLNSGADIEAQSERTKDTPLSLACSGGRYEVVETLLNRGANKEHRNVSDYTPLSLAASGGYVNIIKLLLSHAAEINSRTGSKLGISPLMLAAMNGHTAAVKLLLDMGSDINAQIETNRNTALTLACFQGRHEVVSLLVDRKANVEHRAKTGLTPLMEAASGGYYEVGRVLLDKGADVNAPPVPSSRDTALTIAADKGHYRFVELLLSKQAQVDVKNKKGNSPLWLAANGGHLEVVQLLATSKSDIDSQDNRKVSCLMAAFRKGHLKVVEWMVQIVQQFPSDQEMVRFTQSCNDPDLAKKCSECLDTIRVAKERQAVEANKNATILLEELDMEKNREESKKAAAARRRERKRKKKKEKQERKQLEEENKKNEYRNTTQEIEKSIPVGPPAATLTTTVGPVFTVGNKNSKLSNSLSSKTPMGISAEALVATANCTAPAFPNNNKTKMANEQYEKLKSSLEPNASSCSAILSHLTHEYERDHHGMGKISENEKPRSDKERRKERRGESKAGPSRAGTGKEKASENGKLTRDKAVIAVSVTALVTTASPTISVASNNRAAIVTPTVSSVISSSLSSSSSSTSSSSAAHSSNQSDRKRDPASIHHHYPNHHLFSSSSINSPDDYNATLTYVSNSRTNKSNKKGEANSTLISSSHRSPPGLQNNLKTPSLVMSSPKRGSKREEGWKEVVRKLYVNSRSKKVLVPSGAISRVIGRGGCNINTIREVSGAVIEVEKQKGAGDRAIIIRGSAEATKQAHQLISMMVKDPEKDLSDFLPKNTTSKSLNAKQTGSNQAGNASQSMVSSLSGSQTRATVMSSFLKSGNLPPSGVISNLAFPSSHPPFSGAPVRQPAAIRPGMSIGPPFSTQSSWPAFPTPSLVASSKKNASNSLFFTPGSSQSETSNSLTGATKPGAARLLFSQERGVSQSSVTSCTKTTTYSSYTTAVLGCGKAGTTFASKTADNRAGSLVTPSATTAVSEPSGQATKNPSKAANGNCARSSQSSSKLAGQQAPRSSSLPNGPVLGSGPPSAFSSSTSQPGTPTITNVAPLQPSRQPRAPTPPGQISSSPNLTQDYSPFNNIFSKVAHQSVWGKDKECNNNKGMNFASVAAGNVKTSSSQLCSPGVIGTPVDEGATLPPADAAKAPGYRGSAHVSPGSTSGSSGGGGGSVSGDPISSNSSSRSCLPNSASSTPPIGPIAPPMGSTMRKPSPVDSVLSSSAPAGLNPTSLASLSGSPIGSRQGIPSAGHMQSIAPHNLQPPPGVRPPLELNTNYPSSSQLSPSQGLSGSYATNANSYSAASNSVGNVPSNPIPSIQSNLNPNAPDFSSRSLSNPGNFHHQSQSHPQLAQLHMQRLANLQEGSYHGVAQTFSPANMTPIVSSTQSSGIAPNSAPLSSMAAHQPSGMKYPFQQPNNAFGSEFQQSVRPGVSSMETLGLFNTLNQLQSISGVPPAMSMIPQYGQMMAGLRAGNLTHVVASNTSKDDGPNISPASSPHPSNPSSPMTLSGMNDHPSRSMGDDRKLPRPIGTDRPHKKAQPFGNESSWRGQFGPSNDPMSNERLAPMPTNYMPHYVEGLGGIRENNHPLEASFPQHSLMQGPHPPRPGSGYPTFVNGLQPHVMMSQMYPASAGNRDIWRENSKMNVGAPAGPSDNSGNQLPIGVNPGYFNPGLQQQPTESKPLWAAPTWTQGQM